jgi:ABC-type lipoprotein release transport system permease subunit
VTVATWALLFRLAWRNVLRNRRRSAVILVAIAVGLWSMLVFAAFTRGWSNDVSRNAIDTLTGHLQIHAPRYLQDPSVDHLMSAPARALRTLLDGPAVEAWAARVRVPSVVMSERETAGVTLVGIDPADEEGLSFVAKAVRKGRNLAGPDDNGILIGRKLAERLATGLGKRVVVMSQAADHSVADRGFPIVGVYDADRSSTEMTFVFVGRKAAQEMLGLGSRVSEVAVTLGDPSRLDAFVERVRAAATGLDVQAWTTLEPMAQAMVAMGEAWIWIFYVVMYIAMAFGLVNTMLMAVLERTREFGLVQALGMRPRLILRQVLAESSVLLAAGVLVGGLLAGVTLVFLHDGIDFSAFAEGAEMWGMSKVIYPTLGAGDVVSAIVFIVILGALASLYPALRAARKVPVEAITRG